MAPGGDFDYERHGGGYAGRRRTDPRIEAMVHAALGDDGPVVNVGAGSGSYEPADRPVVAVEPSAAMRAQRDTAAAPVIAAVAEALPFAEGQFAAAMAMVTIHQWPGPVCGLRELRRVTRGPVVVLTFDPDALDGWWLGHYAPELMVAEARRFPPVAVVAEALGGDVHIDPVPVPLDCADGFAEAFYGRPEALLDPAVRAAQSGWNFIAPDAQAAAVAQLADDLRTGEWDRRWGDLRTQPTFAGALRLIRALPGCAAVGTEVESGLRRGQGAAPHLG